MTGESKAMGAMEDSLSDLHEHIAKAVRPRKHFKFTGLLLTAVVAVAVAFASFFTVTRLTVVPKNSEAIKQGCDRRNDLVVAFNAKFAELSNLFGVALLNRPPGQPPPDEDVLRLLKEFERPVQLAPCE